MFYITTVVDEHDLQEAVRQWDYDTTLKFVLDIDLQLADTVFTETLIKRLVASIKNDLDPLDFDNLIEELRQ